LSEYQYSTQVSFDHWSLEFTLQFSDTCWSGLETILCRRAWFYINPTTPPSAIRSFCYKSWSIPTAKNKRDFLKFLKDMYSSAHHHVPWTWPTILVWRWPRVRIFAIVFSDHLYHLAYEMMISCCPHYTMAWRINNICIVCHLFDLYNWKLLSKVYSSQNKMKHIHIFTCNSAPYQSVKSKFEGTPQSGYQMGITSLFYFC
jgi:hypothetical protein